MMRTNLIVAVVAVCISAIAGETNMTPEQIAGEIKYAEELRKLGLDEFADTVMRGVPDQTNAAVVLAKFQAFIHKNRDDQEKIEEHIRKQAGDDVELYWMMRIRLADAYWAWGKQDKCLKIYEEFIKFYQKVIERPKEPNEPKGKGRPNAAG